MTRTTRCRSRSLARSKLTITVEPPKLTPDDEKRLMEAYRAAQDGN
jgi:hypothetical protein